MADITEGLWPKKITLTTHGVQAHGDSVTELIFNEPTGKDLMNLPMMVEGEGMVLPSMHLASKMAGVPPSTIERLNATDAMEVMKLVNPFAGQFLETLGT
ncbi:phage tail assembly protein [Aliamphritea ceti]|uniref:phage tail assembly protein n=1 Tax=Aliamphritea ceti TaxID=1524258 RepID=UPI0021C2F8B2|nr:phage tail assembly protein [Aliamphritea ceti]